MDVNLSAYVAAGLLFLVLPCVAFSEVGESYSGLSSDNQAMNVSECVRYVGFDPNVFILVYRQGRGARNGRGAQFAGIARDVSHRKGLGLVLVDSGLFSDDEIRLLQCFYGKYDRDNTQFYRNPRLLCPKTGLVRNLYLGQPAMNQVRVFADECM